MFAPQPNRFAQILSTERAVPEFFPSELRQATPDLRESSARLIAALCRDMEIAFHMGAHYVDFSGRDADARAINPHFHFDEDVSRIELRESPRFLTELNCQVFLPLEKFFIIQIEHTERITPIHFEVDPASFEKSSYLGKQVWLAHFKAVEGVKPDTIEYSYGQFGFYNPQLINVDAKFPFGLARAIPHFARLLEEAGIRSLGSYTDELCVKRSKARLIAESRDHIFLERLAEQGHADAQKGWFALLRPTSQIAKAVRDSFGLVSSPGEPQNPLGDAVVRTVAASLQGLYFEIETAASQDRMKLIPAILYDYLYFEVLPHLATNCDTLSNLDPLSAVDRVSAMRSALKASILGSAFSVRPDKVGSEIPLEVLKPSDIRRSMKQIIEQELISEMQRKALLGG